MHRLGVLGQHRLLDLGDDPVKREVDALDLDLGRLGVQHRVELLLGELEIGLSIGSPTPSTGFVPPVHRVSRDRQGTFLSDLLSSYSAVSVDVAHVAHALAPRAHAAL